MEQFAIDTINSGGALGVFFVLFLLCFGWCVYKIRDIEKRQNANDAHFNKLEDEKKESERVLDSKLDLIFNKVNAMAADVAVLKDRDERQK